MQVSSPDLELGKSLAQRDKFCLCMTLVFTVVSRSRLKSDSSVHFDDPSQRSGQNLLVDALLGSGVSKPGVRGTTASIPNVRLVLLMDTPGGSRSDSCIGTLRVRLPAPAWLQRHTLPLGCAVQQEVEAPSATGIHHVM